MESVFPFLCHHVVPFGKPVPPLTLSRRHGPSFPRRSPRGFPFSRSVGAGLTTRSSEQRLAGELPLNPMLDFASLCR